MSVGGLTPSIGTMIACRRRVDIPIVAMIRPRTGGFVFSDLEFEAMREDARRLIDAGADGIVVGILDADNAIDRERMAAFREIARGTDCVCHRAFDAVRDRDQALRMLADLGFDRVLTSGGAATAIDGADEIRRLHATSKIEILPGGAIKPHNWRAVAEATGADWLHMSLFTEKPSAGQPAPFAFHRGLPPEHARFVIDEVALQRVTSGQA